MRVFKRLILIILGVLLVFECYLIFSFLQGYESTKMLNRSKRSLLTEKKLQIRMI